MKKKFTRILLLSSITVLVVSSLFGKSPYEKVLGFFHRLNRDSVANEKRPVGTGHDPVSRWYVSQQAEGLIGTTAQSPVDNPTDNVFHVYLGAPVQAGEQVYLVYDLDGVEDHTAVARSINDELSVGGYFVKKRTGWARQKEQLSASWLKPGDNVVRFTLPEGANYSYRVRRVGLEVVPGTESSPAAGQSAQQVVVLDSTALHYYRDQVYVKGYVPGAGDKPIRVTVDGKEARVWKGAFEAIVDSAGKNLQATIEVRYANGTVQRQLVRFATTIEADYRFAMENNLARTQKLSSPERAEKLSLEGAAISIGKGALRSAQTISVTALRKIDIPTLDGGLVNVTRGAAGYRFLPHGTLFTVPVQLALDYDATKIPDGYTTKDIRTYFFDEGKRHWVALPRDSASARKRRLYSRTLHFTDMINGVLKVPESPEVEAYNSNTMKGIKAADPSAAMNLIDAPRAGSMGNASLGYSIEIPAGRHGLQPQLSIGYNSSGGNGWMGIGWNLSVPSIGVDTRWGVPRFDTQNETETYSYNGEQLSPVAHRGNLIARTAEKQFFPRVEGGFDKIIRHGNSPQTYWWEATDKMGTRHFYGGDPSTGVDAAYTLSDASGNIAHWALRMTLDLHGNFIHYFYAKVNDPGVSGGTVMGVQLYLSKITYTGYNGTEGRYSVLFGRDRDIDGHVSRRDVNITAVNGFKQVTADLLRRIDVQLDGTDIRYYELNYKEGAFYKTLLATISQYDAAGHFFNQHSFDYYNDIANGGAMVPLATAQSWSVGSDNVHGGMLTHLSGFTDEASALSGTANHDQSGGVTVSVGLGGDIGSKLNSVGGSFSYSQSQSQGMLSMIDMNGDGLPDKLFLDAGSNTLYYRPNLSGPSGNTRFGDKIAINGINVFQKDKSHGYSVGVEAVAFTALMAGANTGNTTTTSTIYFTEANGDQLPDIVKDGQVYFNHVDPSTGQITFTPTSLGTPSPVFAGVTISKELVDPNELENDRQQAIDNNPLQDIVRMWQAPFTGTINVTAPVQLLPSSDPNRATTPADGVRVAVQLKGTEIWSQAIGPDDYSVHQPTGLTSLSVQKGDRIYFRVGSIDNGSYDSVNWSPVIDYVGQDPILADANGKTLYHYDAAKDFIVSSAQTLTPPINGQVHIGGAFVKPVTSDDVMLVILHAGPGGTDTLWRQTYARDQAINTTISLDNISVSNTDHYSFLVAAQTNIDWAAVSWQPVITFTSAADPGLDLTQTPIQSAAVPQYTLLAYGLQPSLPYNAVLGDGALHVVTVTPQLAINPLLVSGGAGNGTIVFSVKERGLLLGKVGMPVQNGVVKPGNYALNVGVHNGDQLYIEYHVANDTLAAGIITATATLGGGLNGQVPAGLWTAVPKNGKEEDIIFGSFYRGWGQFAWNGNRSYATQPIDEGLLKPSDQIVQKQQVDPNALAQQRGDQLTASQTYDPRKDRFIILVANGSQQRWSSYDPQVFVKGINMSSSRMGAKDLSPLTINSGTGTGSPGIDKVSKVTSTSFTLGASLGPAGASGSYSSSTSKTLTDFRDMNGDRYPDVVSEQLIQYTDARGGLSDRTVANSQIQETETTTTGVALTGSAYIPTAVFRKTPKGALHTDAGTAHTNAGSSKISLSGNAGVENGTNQANFIYLDINGDGLPDRVNQSNHHVALNLGYGFAPEEDWGFDQMQAGGSHSFSGGGGLGYVFGQNSVSAGISLSRSENFYDQCLQDMNGDGLPDLVTAGGTPNGAPVLQVRLNTGNGFSSDVLNWTGAAAINNNSSTTESANLAFTVGFTIFNTVKFTLNPSVNFGDGMSRELLKMEDVNGDGYPDYVSSSKDDNLTVALSTIDRTNLLRAVSRPMGASFTLDYQRVGNSYAMPNSVWTLSSVKIFDGFKGDGPDTLLTTFEYADGNFDRNEREFYGFGTVRTLSHDAANNNSVYTVATHTYANDNYYTKGLVLSELIQGGDGKKYKETKNTYELRDITTGTVLPDSYKTNDAGVAFVALSRADHFYYEGQPQPGKSTFMTYGYDTRGNVTHYTDFGDAGAADDISATIAYHNVTDKYIVGSPKSIVVTGGGATFRKRESTIDTQTGDVTEIRQYLQDGKIAVHNVGYDSYGNLINITGPANAKGQRFRLDYIFDDQVHQFVVKSTSSYGYSSQATYDYRFGEPVSKVDINNNIIQYQLDDLGRMVQVTGPYELAAGVPYTIRFDYHPQATVPWAHTAHFDPAHPGNDMETVTFMDGFGRVLQTKKDAALFQGSGRNDKEQMTVTGRILFDGLGRQSATYYPVVEDKGTDSVFNPTFDNITPTFITHDVLNRVLTTVLPDGSVTRHTYGFGSDRSQQTQFSTKMDDANGKIAEQFTNVRGLTTAMKNYTAGGDVWTSFSYDAINEQLSTTDDLGTTTSSQYDMLGRRVSRSHPDEGTTQYSYDLAGNMMKMVTANLSKDTTAILYSYDFGRMTDISYPHNPENNVHYTYGAAGASFNRAGKVVVQEDGTGAQAFFYGPLGEMLKNIRTVIIPRCEARSFVTQWNYDTWSRLTSMIYPDSEVVSYEYNLGGQLAAMKGKKTCQQHNVYVQQLGYDKFVQRVFLAYGNGTTTTYTFEPDRRRLQNLVAATASGRRMMDNVYSYDKMNNILALVNNAPVPQETPVSGEDRGRGGEGDGRIIGEEPMGGPARYSYTYDDLYRLTTASGYFKGAEQETRYSLQMSYNTVGSILRKTQVHERKEEGDEKGRDHGNGDGQGAADLRGQGNGDGHGDGHADGHTKEGHGDSAWEKVRSTTYDFSYNYGPEHPHAPVHIGKRSYRYDANGNQIRWRSDIGGECRRMLWDEENMLRAVGGEDEEVSLYRYDAGGSRVLKAETEGESVFVNGDHKGGSENLDNFTVYVNPYMVLRSGDFTKHYFIEKQRIASRICEDWSQKVQSRPAGDSINYKVKLQLLVKGIIRDLEQLEGEKEKEEAGPGGKDARGKGDSQALAKEKSLVEATGHGFGEGKTGGDVGSAGGSGPVAGNGDGRGEGPDDRQDEGRCGFDDHGDGHGDGQSRDHVERPVTFLYFYHPDHLGSSSYVTNDSGLVCEHLEYFAFGETFVQERVNTDLIPYLFNAKELDEKTGFYYYGARYYDPRTSIWQSVDQLSEKYPQFSPYAFSFDNPVRFTDADGLEGVPIEFTQSGYTYFPKLAPHQWYSVQGYPDPKTFNSAAVYNLKNNNAWAYTSISERNQFYAWADKQVSSKSKWFAAAEIVTRKNAVGAAESINLWYLSDAAENFLKQGNKYLFTFNMGNAKSIIQTGGLKGSFKDANGTTVTFDGLTGKALDYAMVQFEQTKVQDFIKQYQKNNPNANMEEIMKSINYSMGAFLAPDEVKKVMNENFNVKHGQKAFNFGSYEDRVKLGQKIVDQLYNQ